MRRDFRSSGPDPETTRLCPRCRDQKFVYVNEGKVRCRECDGFITVARRRKKGRRKSTEYRGKR